MTKQFKVIDVSDTEHLNDVIVNTYFKEDERLISINKDNTNFNTLNDIIVDITSESINIINHDKLVRIKSDIIIGTMIAEIVAYDDNKVLLKPFSQYAIKEHFHNKVMFRFL